MTTPTHPRDPRARRAGAHRVDPVDAAVRLELAVGQMRAEQLDHGPAPEQHPFLAADAAAAELDQLDGAVDYGPPTHLGAGFADVFAGAQALAAELAAERVAATAQLGTVEPPLTAQAFADALAPTYPAGETATYPERSGDPLDDGPVFSSEHRELTWRSRHDERSRLFGVRATLPGSAPVVDRMWAPGPVLDQGAEGACVGAAVAGATNVLRMAAAIAAGGPLAMLDLEDAVDIYERAKELDTIPGEAYTGTSVLAGLQAGVEARLIGGYLWAFGTRDIAQAVLQRGPVIVGVPWLSGMYDTGPGGLVELTGDDQGLGHCLVVVGIKRTGPQGQPGPFFVWQNSWGAGYGDNGLGYIHHRDLATLLRGVGEAAIPTREAQEPAA